MRCNGCGATYDLARDSCAERFARLLALDHSRQEPWGSRHGLSFAAYALQHPTIHSDGSRATSWYLLQRVYVQGTAAAHVLRVMRAHPGAVPDDVVVPPLPERADRPPPFGVTIADLGAFDAHAFATLLDAWCRATLVGYGVVLPTP